MSKVGHGSDGGRDFSVAGFWRSLENSLRRLRTDYLDVYLLHDPKPSLYDGRDPIWDALETARSEGRIHHYGASLDTAAEMEACLRNTRSEVLEVFFNIFHQDVRRVFPLARERGAGLIAKIPLDSGWLAGGLGADSRFDGERARWTPGQIAARRELVGRLGWLSGEGTPLARKALGYVLTCEEVASAIPTSRTREHLLMNVEAGRHRLSIPDRNRLEAFWEQITDSGARLLPW